jgi:hypothetical protein
MQERRKHPRIQEKADVTVRIQSSPDAQNLEGRIFSCHSIDISLRGLKLWVNIPVPIGALLELEIVFNNLSTRFQHVGNVVWTWADEGLTDWYNIGIHFNTLANPQFDSWGSAVLKLLEKKKPD